MSRLTKQDQKQLESIRLGNIVRLGKSFTRSVSLTKSIKDNQDILYQYFKSHPQEYFSLFSMRLAYDAKEMLNNIDMRIDMKHISDEDVADLFDAGVINSAGNFYPRYKTLFKHVLVSLTNFDELTLMNTALKGLIDLYGYIELEELYELFKTALNCDMSYRKFLEFINHDSRIKCHCLLVENKGALMRFEGIPLYDLGGQNIQEDGLSSFEYKQFSLTQIIKFADTFDLEGEFPFTSDPNLFLVKAIKRFSTVFDFKRDKELHTMLQLDEEMINKMARYDAFYPKWRFKGHTLAEYEKYIYQDKFNIKDSIIYQA